MRIGRNILFLTLLAILAIASTWFLSIVESSLRTNAPPHDDTPGLVMNEFLAIRMTEEGIREYTVAAPYLEQLPQQQGTRIDQPEVDVFQDGEVRDWLIRAAVGWVSPDNDLIRLQETVSITRPAASGKQPLFIATHDVYIRPADDIVETAEPVRLETPGGVLEAVGLRANLHTKQLELLSEVRGIYELPTP